MNRTETRAGGAGDPPAGTPATSDLAVLEGWLLRLERNRGRRAIDPDEDLIDGGVIDSLEFIGFLLVIEDLRGHEIRADEMSLDAFRTLRSIRARFLDGGADGGR
jgi:acyl carrier protein